MIAVGETGSLLNLPDMYMRTMAVGPRARGAIDLLKPMSLNIDAIADAFGRRVNDVTTIVLDRPRHHDLIEEIRPRIQISRPVAAGRFKATIEELAPGVKLGARVRHKKFGEGVILKVEGHGPQANIQVNFASLGVKIMMLEYLEVVR
jgi:fructose-1,6-bisphosphatase II